MNEAKDNVVVCPTWFTAPPSDTAAWMTGPDRALSPERYFIVVPNHFGAAVSSSPSNTPAPFEKGGFPRVTTYDNVVAQHRLLTEELGVERNRDEVYRVFGARTVEEFIDQFWDAFFLKCDANDLLAQMWTWWHNDLGDHPKFAGASTLPSPP